MAYLAFLYLCDPTLVLKSRAVTNPFPDLSNFFDSDVVFILFRLSNFDEMSNVMGLVTALDFKTKVRFAKVQKGKVQHQKCQREGPFEDDQRV